MVKVSALAGPRLVTSSAQAANGQKHIEVRAIIVIRQESLEPDDSLLKGQ